MCDCHKIYNNRIIPVENYEKNISDVMSNYLEGEGGVVQ